MSKLKEILPESEQPPCANCLYCVAKRGTSAEVMARNYRLKALCINPDVPLRDVHPQFSAPLNLDLKGWSNRAEQIRNGRIRCFIPSLGIIDKP